MAGEGGLTSTTTTDDSLDSRIAKVKGLSRACADFEAVLRDGETTVPVADLSPLERAFMGRLCKSIVRGYRGMRISADEVGRLLSCTGRTVRRVTRTLAERELLQVVPNYYDQQWVCRLGKHWSRKQTKNLYTSGVKLRRFTPDVDVDNLWISSPENPDVLASPRSISLRSNPSPRGTRHQPGTAGKKVSGNPTDPRAVPARSQTRTPGMNIRSGGSTTNQRGLQGSRDGPRGERQPSGRPWPIISRQTTVAPREGCLTSKELLERVLARLMARGRSGEDPPS